MYTYLTIDAHDHCTIADIAAWIGSTDLGNVRTVRMTNDFQGRPMAIVLTWLFGEEWSDGDTAWKVAQEWSAQFGAACEVQITYSEPAIWDLI